MTGIPLKGQCLQGRMGLQGGQNHGHGLILEFTSIEGEACESMIEAQSKGEMQEGCASGGVVVILEVSFQSTTDAPQFLRAQSQAA